MPQAHPDFNQSHVGNSGLIPGQSFFAFWRWLTLSGLLVGCGDKNQEVATSRPEITEVRPSKSRGQLGVSFQRSKYASSPGAAVASNFDLPETEEERLEALRLIEKLISNWGNVQAVRDVMAEARLLETNAILRVAEKLMDHPNEDIRAEALMLADGASSTASLKLFEQAMGDASADIRRLAMESAQQIMDPAVQGLVNMGLEDDDQGVRQLAFHLAMNQRDDIRNETVSRALRSPLEDLALAGMVEAEAAPGKGVLPRVIDSLAHSSPEVRERAREMLTLLFHEEFTSSQHAAAWWRENQQNYDDDLVYSPR